MLLQPGQRLFICSLEKVFSKPTTLQSFIILVEPTVVANSEDRLSRDETQLLSSHTAIMPYKIAAGFI